ncbi:MAG: AbrB/MazE/SpoVT family DNA-binding domain-containing protein [Anaerolineales bacterium]|jgi:antitoxin MazE|nr:AbrB/MazE/SpoVT family DNA-binding domain-containing protein [Anaerolineales bacterium]
MKTRVQKWGNSCAIRIPKYMVREAGLENNAEVEIRIEKGKLIIQPVSDIKLDKILAQVNENNLHRAVETGTAVGNEAW